MLKMLLHKQTTIKSLKLITKNSTAYKKNWLKNQQKTAVEQSNEEARVKLAKALEEYNTALAAYNASVTANQEATESNKLAWAEYEAKLADYKTKKLLMMVLRGLLDWTRKFITRKSTIRWC